MSGSARQFRALPDEPPAALPPPQPQPQQANAVATRALLLALGALSQRFVIAVSNLFTLALAASAFYLWLSIFADPTVMQLIGLSLYGVFVFGIEIIRRRG